MYKLKWKTNVYLEMLTNSVTRFFYSKEDVRCFIDNGERLVRDNQYYVVDVKPDLNEGNGIRKQDKRHSRETYDYANFIKLIHHYELRT